MQTASGTDLDRALALIDESGDSWETATVPWIVQEVHALPDYGFRVRFIDGLERVVRMREKIFRDSAGVFTKLRDPQVFATVRVEDGDVVWPNGLDLAPDAMYDEIKAHGEWVLPPLPPPSASE